MISKYLDDIPLKMAGLVQLTILIVPDEKAGLSKQSFTNKRIFEAIL